MDERYPRIEKGDPYVKESDLDSWIERTHSAEKRLVALETTCERSAFQIETLQRQHYDTSQHIQENLIRPLQSISKDLTTELQKTREEMADLRATVRTIKRMAGKD